MPGPATLVLTFYERDETRRQQTPIVLRYQDQVQLWFAPCAAYVLRRGEEASLPRQIWSELGKRPDEIETARGILYRAGEDGV